MLSSWYLIVGFAGAFGIALLAIPPLARQGARLGLLDRPGGRHGQADAVPMVGGIAVFLAVTIPSLLIEVWPGGLVEGSNRTIFYAILGGGAGMHLLGVLDDRKDLAPWLKLVVQTAIAGVVFFAGVRLAAVNLPLLGFHAFGVGSSLVLTVLWMVAVTNAFNLVDGTDGLSAGAALTATLSMFVVSLVFGHAHAALLLALAAGALLAFLHFNFPPATVYLGDGGSLFIGFILASLGLVSATKTATVVAIAIPVVALGLPVVDTTLATFRRLISGRRISRPDRGHIHHRLAAHGLTPRQVAVTLWAVSAVFGVASMLLTLEDSRLTGFVFLIVGASIVYGLHRLRIPELLELRHTLGRGLRQRQVISHNLELHRATARLGRAQSMADVFRELDAAVRESTVNEAELWLSGDFVRTTAIVGAVPGAAPSGVGSLWCWSRNGPTRADTSDHWEIKLPLVDGSGLQVGRLTLRRPLVEELPSDMRVLARQFVPSIIGAFERLRLEDFLAPDSSLPVSGRVEEARGA